jgi:hypothetical protein
MNMIQTTVVSYLQYFKREKEKCSGNENLDAIQTWYLNYITIDTCHGLFLLFEVIDDCSFLKYWLNPDFSVIVHTCTCVY